MEKEEKRNRKMVSFVIPCYRSEKTLPGVTNEIEETMKQLPAYDYEVILVNDCSPDGTLETIKTLCREKKKFT